MGLFSYLTEQKNVKQQINNNLEWETHKVNNIASAPHHTINNNKNPTTYLYFLNITMWPDYIPLRPFFNFKLTVINREPEVLSLRDT